MPLKWYATDRKLTAQTVFIDGLQKAGPEYPVHLDGCAYDCPGEPSDPIKSPMHDM